MGYLDNTGTYVKIGPEVAVPQAGGEYKTYGALRELEVLIPDLTKVTSTDANLIGSDNIFIPAGFKVERVVIVTDTAATSGGSATLNLGLIGTDRTTVYDTSAFINAMAVASLTAGSEITLVKGSTSAGTKVGTGAALAGVNQISVKYGTAAFTAGALRIRIYLYRA